MNQISSFNFRGNKNTVCIVCFLLITWKVSAQQSSAIPPNMRATNTIDRLTDSNGLGLNEMMFGIPLPEGKVIGDTYLSTEWKRTTILLYESEKLIEGYSTRYDIQTNELDIKTNSNIKALSGDKIKTFVWMDSEKSDPSYFINAKDFKYHDTLLIGFFEVLLDKEAPLLKKIPLDKKKADYNVALGTGSIDDKIVKSVKYYCIENNEIVIVPGIKKKLLPLFHDHAKNVDSFIKTHSLSVKKEDHLLQIYSYYNTLILASKKTHY